MHITIIRLLIMFVCCLPTFVSATTNYSIHAEWTSYTPPSGFTVTGYKLYQEGALACQVQDPIATAMDCQVFLNTTTTNFTLTATFSDGTESSQSSPFVFSTPIKAATVTANCSIHAAWTSYTPPSGFTVTGYKLYQEGTPACQIQDPNATAMDCQVTLKAATTNFTLAATFSDGTESQQSSPFVFSTPSETTTELKAVITTNTASGSAPLSINFNATASTGGVASYLWDFGDGSSATGDVVTHIYTITGSYTATLTVSNTAGLTSIASTIVNVTTATSTIAPTPPTAVISSSTAAGAAPLIVNFNGSGSTAATNASIASYSWSFGDGSSTTGASATHTFTEAGTYSTNLTITDSNGLTSSTSTPIVVTAPLVITNQTPTAVANATPMNGTAPLTITFNGSFSTDTDGTIASYVWNFGDGSTGTGKTVTHTYTTAGTYTAALQVIDNQGANNTYTLSITAADPFATLNIELGEIAVSSNWVRVPITSTYQTPIVVAGPSGFNDDAPCVVRLRNVDKTGFEIKLSEWDYEDGIHPEETISYLVMEKGRITLPDGSSVEAGSFQGTASFNTIKFSKSFARIPVVMTTVASFNEPDTISGRIKHIGISSFAYYFREQEKNINTHAPETVNFIAWQPGKGTIGSVQYEVATTTKSVTSSWYTRIFNKSFSQPPLLLADLQTTNDTDPSELRIQQVSTTGFQVKVEEETSKSTNTTHSAETVGYLGFEKVE